MPRSWLFPGVLLAAFAVISLAQQAGDELSDKERLVQLEKQVNGIERMLAGLTGDGTVEMTPALLESRLARIEIRLDRIEPLVIRSSGPAGASADRMTDGRLRALENAVMRLQQQR